MRATLTNLGKMLFIGGLLLAALVPSGSAQAAKLTTLHSFCSEENCADGRLPQGALVADANGNLYGTTATGGSSDFGTAFKLTRGPNGKLKFKTIYSFCARFCGVSSPQGPLVVDTQGNLYGTGANAVYELSPGFGRGGHLWKETILYAFCSQQNCADGSDPAGGLTYAGRASGALYDGTSSLYGVTSSGGSNGNGTVFGLAARGGRWSTTVLYNFCSRGGSKCLDGSGPFAGLLLTPEGVLYGTTEFGGGNNFGSFTNGSGVVFELSPSHGHSWTETVLHSFCAEAKCQDGGFPRGAVIMDAEGSLLGTAAGGGRTACSAFGCGVLFKLVPTGEASEETVLYAFCKKSDCSDGREPLGSLLLDAGGNLFGTTEFGGGNDIDVNGLGGGIAFKLADANLKVLQRFCSLESCVDGAYPLDGPILDESGNLFGTTSSGGAVGGGTAFVLKP